MLPLIVFAYEQRLWLLLLVPLLAAAYLVLLLRQGKQSRRFGLAALEKVMPKQQAWKRHIAVACALLSLTSLNVAFAQPSDEVDVPSERATVVLAIDVSNSMKAKDVAPNRLDAAKVTANEFIDMVPAGFNVSLVSFAGTAAVVVPPTSDRGLVKQSIDRLKLAPATAIGEGIYSSLDALALVPPDPLHPDEPTPAAIVLLSDGETNIGRSSATAALDAKKQKTPIFTIAYGTPGGYVETETGARQPVAVNVHELAKVAELSGGKAFTAGSSSELRSVYQSIARSIGFKKRCKR